MPNPRDFFRRLQPRDPRDWRRNVVIAVCSVIVVVLIVVLFVTGHGG